MSLHPQDFSFFEQLLKRESGLALTPDKAYLLESRLMPVAFRHELESLAGIAFRLRQGGCRELLRDVVEAMATSETSFFRDLTPFQRLKDDVLPALLKARAGDGNFRIWSAACASGQEPYSIAMLLQEMALPLAGWKYEILATDMSAEILEKASAAVYSQFEVQRGLPVQMLVKYMEQGQGGWRVRPQLREKVNFRPFNLLDSARPLGLFDIIFCRNVLIYFDVETKIRVLNSLHAALRPGGALFLGGAETVLGLTEALQPVEGLQGVYARSDEKTAARMQPFFREEPDNCF